MKKYKIIQNRSTPENIDFWDSAEKSAEKVKCRLNRANVGIDFDLPGIKK